MTPANEQVAALPVHVHDVVSPAVNNKWKWLVATGNLVIGCLELAFGFRVSFSLLVDALHNATDVGTYLVQSKNAIEGDKMSTARLERRRILSYWAISGVSVLLGLFALVHLIGNVDLMPHRMGLATALSSLIFNVAVYLRMRFGTWNMPRVYWYWQAGLPLGSIEDDDLAIKDLDRHFIYADIPSAALAVAGVLAQPFVHDAEQVAAIISSVIVAIAFRPTKKHLAH